MMLQSDELIALIFIVVAILIYILCTKYYILSCP